MAAGPARPPLWPILASVGLSLAMAVAVGRELAALEWRELVTLLPTSALFWGVFALYYLTTVLGDFAIFRRLWGPGPGGMGVAGFLALIRKQVYNDIVLAYLGEGAFFAWARRRAQERAKALLGTIKDVAILSALAGNAVTVVLVGAALFWAGPQVAQALTGMGALAAYSIVLVLGLSLVPLVWRRRVFFLPANDLAFAFAVHVARVVVRALLGVIVWHLLLPDVPLSWWLWLAALRQVVSRLPLVANKDLIFAGLAVLVLDDGTQVASIIALTAALLVVANVAVGLALLLGDAATMLRRGGKRAMDGPKERARR